MAHRRHTAADDLQGRPESAADHHSRHQLSFGLPSPLPELPAPARRPSVRVRRRWQREYNLIHRRKRLFQPLVQCDVVPSLELIVILARRSDVDQGKTDFTAPASTRRPWPPLHVSLASRTEARADPRGSRTNQGPIGGLSGGLEPCRCSRPARDAAPTITPTIFCSVRLAADAGPGRRRSQLPQIRPDALDAPDFVGIGAKPARQDGQRGRRSGGGSVLGHLASWHDRGPGGRHDDGARSRGRGHPRPQTGLDRKWL